MTKEYKIAVIPGDGTGPEVVDESIKVLNTVSNKCGFKLGYTHYPLGGEHYKKTGEILNDDTIARLQTADAILLGAIGVVRKSVRRIFVLPAMSIPALLYGEPRP